MAASTVFPSFAIGKPGKSANSKLNIAFIGSGGWIARQPYEQGCSEENLVAFCDVDRNLSAENMKNWRTTQPFFDDFRVMLDKMHKDIDAVVVSTPDHTHFAATLMAMERGIHVYTQKPLTHNIWQCRTLVKARDRYKVVTQMGNQGHAGDGIRQSVEAVRAGVIGDVSEVFARNDGPEMGGRSFRQSSDHAAAVVAGARWARMGPVARPAGQARILCATIFPRNGGRFMTSARHARRLGLPHARHAGVGARSRSADGRRMPPSREIARGRDPHRQPHRVSFPRQGQPRTGQARIGSTARRTGARSAASTSSAPNTPHTSAAPAGWSAPRACSAAAPTPEHRSSLPERSAQGVEGKPACADHPARRGRAVPRMDARHQGRGAGTGIEFHLRRQAHRDHSVRCAGPAFQHPHRMGRQGRATSPTTRS